MPYTTPRAPREGLKSPTLVEYVDFRAGEAAREYRLRVRRGTDSWGVTVAIPNEAFLSGRARYQDAPDICFLKVQKELAATGEDGLIAGVHLSLIHN